MPRNYVQAQDFTLNGSGIGIADTTIPLSSFTLPNSNEPITMAMFGDIGYGTLEPETPREENISFTGVTQNANGTAELTGVVRGLDLVDPYTVDLTLRQSHAGATIFRITNSVQLYAMLANKYNDEDIEGLWTFLEAERPELTADVDATIATQLITLGQLARATFSGAVPASPTVPGIAMVANQTDIDTGNDQRNFSGNPYYVFVTPSQLDSSLLNIVADCFGDGSDGTAVINSNTSLTRDMYYENLTIDPTFTLDTASYRIYVRDTFINNGTIRNNGGDGGNGVTATAVVANSTISNGGAGGTAGTGSPLGTLIGSLPGLAGEPGSNGMSLSDVDAVPAAAVLALLPQGIAGSDGGDSIANPAPRPESNGGAATLGTQAVTKLLTNFELEYLSQIIAGVLLPYYPTQQNSQSAGGCGGRNFTSGSNSTDAAAGGGGAGGGGGNGGIVWIFANSFTNNGTIEAIGGNGGDAGAGGDCSAPTGLGQLNNAAGSGGGGGAGGNGGLIIIGYGELYDQNGTLDVSGGTGGALGAAGVGSGGVATSGLPGTAGLNGTPGLAKAVKFPIV